MPKSEKDEPSRSTQRWVGFAMFVVGLVACVMPWTMLDDAQEEHDAAVAQQAWLPGECVVTSSSIIEVPQKDGGTPDKTLAVTFTLLANGRPYEGLGYTYPTHWGADPRRHAEGMRLACYYDGSEPTRAALVRKGAPTEPRPDASFVTLFITLLGLAFAAAGVATFFSRKRWHNESNLPDHFWH